MAAIALNAENKFVELLVSRRRTVAQIQADAAIEIEYLMPIIMTSNGPVRAAAQSELNAWQDSAAAAAMERVRLMFIESRLGIVYGAPDCSGAPVFTKAEIALEEFLFVMFEALLDARPLPLVTHRRRTHEACTHA